MDAINHGVEGVREKETTMKLFSLRAGFLCEIKSTAQAGVLRQTTYPKSTSTAARALVIWAPGQQGAIVNPQTDT